MTYQLYDYQQTLVKQARRKIANGSQGVMIQAPPGSGKSVVIAEIARLATSKQNHVLFIVHRKELAEQIEQSFVKNKVNMNHVTIQTVIKAWNRRETMAYPQIIITDETHHSRAKTYQKLYDYFDNAFRLGFTATPWRMNGKGFSDIYDDLITGPSVKWLINNGRLAPYRYFAESSIDREHLKQNSMGDYDNKSIAEEFNQSRIYGEIVRHYNKHAKGKKAIAYAPSVEISKQITEEFQKAGIKATHADGKTPKKEREQVMDDFRNNKIQVLVNVDLISEGFDVPDCSCVILARPTKSLVLYIQQAMRAMRYQPKKEAIILDHVGNVHEFGLPDMEREWTIKGRNKKKSNKKSETLAKQCPTCAAWISPQMMNCPYCEHEFKQEQTIKFEDGDLEEVDKESFIADYKKIKFKKKWGSKNKDDLESVEDYYLFAKARGYKDSWLKYQIPEFKQLNWPQFYTQLKPLKQKYKQLN